MLRNSSIYLIETMVCCLLLRFCSRPERSHPWLNSWPVCSNLQAKVLSRGNPRSSALINKHNRGCQINYVIETPRRVLGVFFSTLWIQAVMHRKEIQIYVCPEKELRGLSPNCHIHVSVRDLYSIFARPVLQCTCLQGRVKVAWVQQQALKMPPDTP